MSEYTTMTIGTRCELCGKGNCSIVSLLDSYSTNDIKFVCNECADFANDQLWKLRAVNQNWISKTLKIFLRNKRKQFTRKKVSDGRAF